MAIVQLEQPAHYVVSAYNKILFKVLSDQVLQVGFKYVVKVINNRTNTVISTAYYIPSNDPAQKIEIDVSHFIQGDFNLYKGLFVNTSNDHKWLRSDSMITPFSVEFGEFYDIDADGLLEIDTNTLVLSKDYFAIPYAVNPYEIKFFDASDNFNNSFVGPFTNWFDIKLPRNSFYNFAFLSRETVPNTPLLWYDIAGCYVKQYDSNNNLISDLDYAIQTIPNNEYEVISYFHFRGTKILPNASYVKLIVYYPLLTGTFRTNHFATIYPLDCKRSTSKTLFYLNKYGAYDSYTFPLNNFTTKEINKKTYKRYADDYGYTDEDGIFRHRNTMPVYHSAIKTRMVLQTNWLSDNESYNLQQLFSSSSVYLLDNENVNSITQTFRRDLIIQPVKLIPVNIIDTNYEVKYSRSHKNFQYTLNLEFSELEPRQTL